MEVVITLHPQCATICLGSFREFRGFLVITSLLNLYGNQWFICSSSRKSSSCSYWNNNLIQLVLSISLHKHWHPFKIVFWEWSKWGLCNIPLSKVKSNSSLSKPMIMFINLCLINLNTMILSIVFFPFIMHILLILNLILLKLEYQIEEVIRSVALLNREVSNFVYSAPRILAYLLNAKPSTKEYKTRLFYLHTMSSR